MIRLMLFAAQAWAEEGHGAHGGPVEIPWKNLWAQGFNLAVLLGLLFYVLRHSVKAHFETRAREYEQLVARAEAARQEAEQNKQAIEQRLTKLQASAERTAQEAKGEADKLRTKLMEEAKVLTAKMEQEAQRSAALELEKAKAELRHELLERALSSAGENLGKNLSSNEQKKLQHEFVEKIQVVGG
jgi:F-type H+-transporting ATPase subunit b